MIASNRRKFIKSTSLVFGSVLLLPSCMERDSYRFFTNGEALCVIALCEQIIPRDESPGATDAGVIYYIDRQLTGVFNYDQGTYRNGIKNIQAYSKGKYSKNFELLSSEKQIKIMKLLENSQFDISNWRKNDSSVFFNLIRNHTMQGFYGSPIHGGNEDYVSFEMLKVDYPLVIGQNRYRKQIG